MEQITMKVLTQLLLDKIASRFCSIILFEPVLAFFSSSSSLLGTSHSTLGCIHPREWWVDFSVVLYVTPVHNLPL